MNKLILVPVVALLLLASAGGTAWAHGHTSFEINGKNYSFTVGSLNEPIAVDDKTGVDLRVMIVPDHYKNEEEHAGIPATGLEQTLKVELIAGDKRKTLDLATVFGAPGSYKAAFYPTVQTTYSYRVFGTIDNTPFDYTWTCNPAGHPRSPEDKIEAEISPGVKRIEVGGAFGCPVAKTDLGFPEPSASLNDLSSKVNAMEASLADLGATSRNMTMLAILLALAGVIFGVIAWRRK